MSLRLIAASAGTGKTYRLAEIFVERVALGDPIQSIVVVTFTRAATAELRQRLRARLRAAGRAESDPARHGRVLRALADIDRARIFTIHSLCARLLTEHAFACGAPASQRSEATPLHRCPSRTS